MSDETTLLPCPFCGGEADEYEGEYGNGIYCMMCGAKMGDPIHLEYRLMKRVSIDKVIAAWNTREPVEYDGWFYLPKSKESIVQCGAQRIEKTEIGYRVEQPVEVIESAIRSYGNQLGEHIMKRLCEVWNIRAERPCKCGWRGFVDGWGYEPPNYCPNCGGKAVKR